MGTTCLFEVLPRISAMNPSEISLRIPPDIGLCIQVVTAGIPTGNSTKIFIGDSSRDVLSIFSRSISNYYF